MEPLEDRVLMAADTVSFLEQGGSRLVDVASHKFDSAIYPASSDSDTESRGRFRARRTGTAPVIDEAEALLNLATFGGSTEYVTTARGTKVADQLVAVDPGRTYRLSGTGESGADGAAYNSANRQYFGYAMYDAGGVEIKSHHSRKVPGAVTTTLAQPIANGDMQIVLSNASGWHNDSGHSSRRYRRVLGWSGPNNDGNTYDVNEYTRNVEYDFSNSNGLWSSVQGNTLILNSPWTGGSLAAGTEVANFMAGAAFNYSVLSWANVPDSSTDYQESSITGVWQDGESSYDKFRPGTEYIKPIVLMNRHSTGSTGDNQISWGDVEFAYSDGLGFEVGDTVQLSVDASDVDGDTLTYFWTQTGGPAAMSDSPLQNPTFTTGAAHAGQTLVFDVTVSDGSYTATSQVSVFVRPSTTSNAPPVIDEAEALLNLATFGGSTEYVTTARGTKVADQLVAVDPDRTYRLSGTGESGADGAAYNSANRQYFGYAMYDADGVEIKSYHALKVPGAVTTTLAQPITNGDMQIVLSNASGWHNDNGYSSRRYRRVFGWSGLNSDGNTYDVSEYTRNVEYDFSSSNGLWSSVQGNTLILNAPWTGGSIAAGTEVANFMAGNAFNYSVLSWANVPDSPTDYEASSITGVLEDGESNYNKFRPGTEYIKPIVLMNRHSTGSTGDNQISWRDIEFAYSDGLGFEVGDTVQLSVDATDVDGDTLTYAWAQADGPTAVLSNSQLQNPTFTTEAAHAGQTLIFDVAVSDGTNTTVSQVTVSVRNDVSNTAPELTSAAAFVDSAITDTIDVGDIVTLTATATDQEGGELFYHWRQISGPTVILGDQYTSAAKFQPTLLQEDSTLIFQVTVADEGLVGDTRYVAVAVNNLSSPAGEPPVGYETLRLVEDAAAYQHIPGYTVNDSNLYAGGGLVSFVKYDITNVSPDVDFLTIEVSPHYTIPADSPIELTLHQVSNAWDETTVNWVNQPEQIKLIHQWTTAPDREFVDVTGEVKQALKFGDLNGDAQYDLADIAAFEAAVKSPARFEEDFGFAVGDAEALVRADANHDGVIDHLDLEGFLQGQGAVIGDLDSNGTVEFADFLILSTNFTDELVPGAGSSTYFLGDLDLDSDVDSADSDLLVSLFNRTAERTTREISFAIGATNASTNIAIFRSSEFGGEFVPTVHSNKLLEGDPDVDFDGINDDVENAVFGTSTDTFDTDGDLLSDLVELMSNGLDPFIADDRFGDLDGDSLNNLDEVINGTDLDEADTDGDGTSDADEISQGSDPKDDTDSGQPPLEENVVDVVLKVGDPSGSESERYDLIVGDVIHQAPEFGEVEEDTYKFRKGTTNEITIVHRGSNLPSPNYDWVASVSADPAETSMIITEDETGTQTAPGLFGSGSAQYPNAILREHIWNVFGDPFLAEGKTAYLHIPKADLIARDPGLKEQYEETVGAYIGLNNDDDDGDGTIDSADPLVTGGDDDLREFEIADLPQRLRELPGDFIVTFGSKIKVYKDNEKRVVVNSGDKLRLDEEHSLFIEGVTNSTSFRDEEIRLQYVPLLSGMSNFTVTGTAEDVVKLTVLNVDLDIDSDNSNALGNPNRSTAEDLIEADPQKSGKLVRINDQDLDADGLPDYVDGFRVGTHTQHSVNASANFTPIKISIPSPVDLTKATIAFQYSRSIPALITDSDGDGLKDTPSEGRIRIWTKDGDQLRNGVSVSGGGDWVDVADFYTPAELGINNATREITLYVEGVEVSPQEGADKISISVDLGEGPGGNTLTDEINFTVVNAAVQGKIQYDITGPLKPVRGALVIAEMPGGLLGPKEVGRSWTDDDGNYTIALDPVAGNVYTGLTVKVRAESRPAGTGPQQVKRAVLISSSPNEFTFPVPVATLPTLATPVGTADFSNISSATDAGKAFFSFDAGITAAKFHSTLDAAPVGTIKIDSPSSIAFNSSSWCLRQHCHIFPTHFDDWDIVAHEYGHGVAQGAGFFVLTVLPTPSHDPWVNLRTTHQELNGNTLAFSEGWASFFSIAAQHEAGVSNPAVGNAGDLNLEVVDGSGTAYQLNVEANNVGPVPNLLLQGEDNEIAVMRLLWDLYDPINPSPIDNDNISLGINGLFDVLVQNRVTTVEQLWHALTRNASVRQKIDYGRLFAAHSVGVDGLAVSVPATGVSQTAAAPNFAWSVPQVSGGNGNAFNTFGIKVFDSAFNEIYDSGELTTGVGPVGNITYMSTNASFVPTLSDWQQINATVGQKHWIVYSINKFEAVHAIGDQTVTLQHDTGTYWSDSATFNVIP